ncbi:hypothetical protein SAMN05216227_100578 [Pseudorhodobacter antarcticus]|jgi:hypothetical protein|uniref:PH domain-containing protein n=1 Tax=Pseudorhodobacter antarcticus TaxID=1077947 RepID=A0A1H8CR05_9RHOB|nr:hypothetical protein [Pseudorhodobacter antarcticus]SEM96547.1 hypothetical protein SAMN05216227_100578 [Pseudorhodobacter antarcticus]
MVKDDKTVLARLDASQPRRVIGAVAQVGLAAVLVSLAISFPREQMGLRIILLLLGGVMAYAAHATWRATEMGLTLTKDGLVDGHGRVLADLANVREVARGPFALKPSHGFSLLLFKAPGFAWVPGLWWRVGTRVGVGGVTASQPARFMAETIAGMVAARDAPPRDDAEDA